VTGAEVAILVASLSLICRTNPSAITGCRLGQGTTAPNNLFINQLPCLPQSVLRGQETVKQVLTRCMAVHLTMGAGVPVSQDSTDIETDIVETLLRRLAESGRVSATRTDTGDYQIDPAELHRVFPLGTGQGRANEQDATALLAETALLQAQIDNLRQMGELLRNELEHLNSQADRLLLTQSAPAAPAKLAGWLRRLAG
jgi:hypothetical protein